MTAPIFPGIEYSCGHLRSPAWFTWFGCAILFLMGCQPATTPVIPRSPSAQGDPTTKANESVHQSDQTETPKPTTVGTRLHFRDATAEWGLRFTRFDDIRGEYRAQETIGGGVALFDMDLDGRLDVFLTQGCRLPRREKTDEYSNEIYRNTGHFERVTIEAGLLAHGYYTGCAAADFNEDGFPDLYLTAYGPASLWQNNGDGTFQEMTVSSGLSISSWSTSAAWSDFNGDGLLDLFVGTYVELSDDSAFDDQRQKNALGTSDYLPILFTALDDFLFVNDGQGGFHNVTREAGITGSDGRAQGVLATDLTGDGWSDIFVANDMTPCFLYINETGSQERTLIEEQTTVPHFTERGIEFGVAVNGEGKATAAMGIGHGDYDRDGWLDLHITNFILETNTLFRNLQGTGFIDASSQSRIGPPSRNTLAFGNEFLDVDHDGWLDLFVPTGHINDQPRVKPQPYRMRPHLFRNERNGRFTDVAADAGTYFTSEWIGRGLAIGDVDRDGDLDMVVAHQVDPSALLLNETPLPGTSVIIKPVGKERSPRSGIGTRIKAVGVSPALVRDLAGGGSFLSTSAEEIHLGLGESQRFEQLEVTWPDGHIDFWPNVAAGYYVAIKGKGLIRIEQNAN